jgi:peptidyl-Lys metalloendopeptidase
MRMMTIFRAALAILMAASCLHASAASNDVAASIHTAKNRLGPTEDVVLQLTLTNNSAAPQYMLKWHTPFGEEIEESLFEVTRDGVKVPYLGAHYKRAAPTAKDYFLLKAGQSYNVSVELSALYDMSITGDYVIRYRTASLNLFSKRFDANGRAIAEQSMGEIASPALSVWIDGRQARGTLTLSAAPQATTASLSFNKCTASQSATITTALDAGLTMVTDGGNYLGAGKTGSRYTHWFGSNDATRYATVKAHFVALKDAFANKPVTVDCGCKKTYYAYVFPNQPYTIYVCKAFWSAPMTGTDSKGGTLVHEMSHFTAVAGTDDWVYGQAGAASLAVSDPAKAIDNADTHEYFGENTPALQ